MARFVTAEDFRGLMPLIYGHISPYGTFVLDLTSRLKNIEPPVITLPPGDGQSRSTAHRQSGRAPQSPSHGMQQLALFNTSL